jgi:hypothetical protein
MSIWFGLKTGCDKLWYNDGVQVRDEHKCEYFGLKAILFVTVIESPVAGKFLGQSKKVGCRCPHYFREIESKYLSESQKIMYVRHQCDIPMKHQF